MAKLIYLAYPIDRVDSTDTTLFESIQYARNYMAQMEDTFVFDPGRAWAVNSDPDPRLRWIDNAVVVRADLVFAFLPGNHNTVGVPAEIAMAEMCGIPSMVVRQEKSWYLQSDLIHIYDSLSAALEELGQFSRQDAPAPIGPVAQYRLDPPPGDLDWLDPTPRLAYPDDAGFDLAYHGAVDVHIEYGNSINVPVGCSVAWPANTWGLLIGRSSTFHKRGLLVNTAVIDPGYRGDLFVSMRRVGPDLSGKSEPIKPGDRIAQIIPLPALAPKIDMVQVEELPPSQRGARGFGSSGR